MKLKDSVLELLNSVDIKDCVLITHDVCLDGAGCAVNFIKAGGLEESIFYVMPSNVGNFIENNFFSNNKFLIMADVSVNTDYANKLKKRGNCVIIDHHKTASKLNKFDFCAIDESMCGSLLLFNYLKHSSSFLNKLTESQEDELKEFSIIINDNDLWIREDKTSDDLKLYRDFVGNKYFVNKFAYGKFDWHLEDLFVLDVLEEKRNEFKNKQLLKVKKKYFGNKKVPYAYVMLSKNDDISFILNEILSENSDIKFAMAVALDVPCVSLRSRDDFDVSKIAKQNGGGGHHSAAGYPISLDFLDDIVEELI